MPRRGVRQLRPTVADDLTAGYVAGQSGSGRSDRRRVQGCGERHCSVEFSGAPYPSVPHRRFMNRPHRRIVARRNSGGHPGAGERRGAAEVLAQRARRPSPTPAEDPLEHRDVRFGLLHAVLVADVLVRKLSFRLVSSPLVRLPRHHSLQRSRAHPDGKPTLPCNRGGTGKLAQMCGASSVCCGSEASTTRTPWSWN